MEENILVYFIDNIDLCDEKFFDEIRDYISTERLKYAYRYRFFSDRIQSVLAYALLRVALYEEYGIRFFPEIKKSQYGKPFIYEHPEIHFNLSHCKKGVACAISSGNVGVDIQEYLDYNSASAELFMCHEEKEIAENGDSKTEFTRIWTLKESLGKYIGKGICYDMNKTFIEENICINGCTSKSFLFEDFVLSVTAEELIQIRRMNIGELKKTLNCLEIKS